MLSPLNPKFSAAHQILILDPDAPAPRDLDERSARFRERFSDYRLWDRRQLSTFLADSFGDPVARAFANVKPYAYKADIARYAIMNTFGGWYFDHGLRDINPPAGAEDVDLVVFRDRQEHTVTTWAVQNGLIFARPGLDVFREALDRCVYNIARHYYGVTPLHPTGPVVFGRALAMYGEDVRLTVGEFVSQSVSRDDENLVYVDTTGRIWARYKSEPAGQIGLPGGNAYNELWHLRDVYS